jgi:hypothetical protein
MSKLEKDVYIQITIQLTTFYNILCILFVLFKFLIDFSVDVKS